MKRDEKRWEAPRIDGGAEAGPVIDGLRALHAALAAVQEASDRLDEAGSVFAEADIADVVAMIETTKIALHSTVGRRVTGTLFALKQLEATRAARAAPVVPVAASLTGTGRG